MTAKEQNDFFYVCSLIEYVARITKNRRRVGWKNWEKKESENNCMTQK